MHITSQYVYSQIYLAMSDSVIIAKPLMSIFQIYHDENKIHLTWWYPLAVY